MASAACKLKADSRKLAASHIDALCSNYKAQEAVALTASENLDALRQELIDLAKKHGIVPPAAAKTFRLEGDEYQADASFGISTAVDEDVIHHILAKLSIAGRLEVFDHMFAQKTSYVVAPAAHETLAAIKPSELKREIKRLFARAVIARPRNPTLKVQKKFTKKGRAK